MKKQKQYISTMKQLIIGLLITIFICICATYIYNAYMVGTSIHNIPAFILGIIVFAIALASFFTSMLLVSMLIAIILSKREAKKSHMKSKEQIKALPSNFVNVRFKDFDNFPLADFVSSEDITCFAKLDENGKVVYAIQLNVEYETGNYVKFLNHFDI